jgi:DNA polymerase III epsilon subunit-like protein
MLNNWRRSYRFLVVDFETTGLGKTTSICEIGATSLFEQNKTYSTYVLPDCEIKPEASRVNHLTKRNGCLYYYDKQVSLSTPYDAFDAFTDWISDHTVDSADAAILIAHNAHNFDAPGVNFTNIFCFFYKTALLFQFGSLFF